MGRSPRSAQQEPRCTDASRGRCVPVIYLGGPRSRAGAHSSAASHHAGRPGTRPGAQATHSLPTRASVSHSPGRPLLANPGPPRPLHLSEPPPPTQGTGGLDRLAGSTQRSEENRILELQPGSRRPPSVARQVLTPPQPRVELWAPRSPGCTSGACSLAMGVHAASSHCTKRLVSAASAWCVAPATGHPPTVGGEAARPATAPSSARAPNSAQVSWGRGNAVVRRALRPPQAEGNWQSYAHPSPSRGRGLLRSPCSVVGGCPSPDGFLGRPQNPRLSRCRGLGCTGLARSRDPSEAAGRAGGGGHLGPRGRTLLSTSDAG